MVVTSAMVLQSWEQYAKVPYERHWPFFDFFTSEMGRTQDLGRLFRVTTLAVVAERDGDGNSAEYFFDCH